MLYYNKEKKELAYSWEIGVKKQAITVLTALYTPMLFCPVYERKVESIVKFMSVEIPEAEPDFDYYTWLKFGVALYAIEMYWKYKDNGYTVVRGKMGNWEMVKTPDENVARAMDELPFYSAPIRVRFTMYKNNLLKSKFFKTYGIDCLKHNVIVPSVAFRSKQRLTAVLEGLFSLAATGAGYSSMNPLFIYNIAAILKSVYNMSYTVANSKFIAGKGRYMTVYTDPNQKQIRLLNSAYTRLPTNIKLKQNNRFKLLHILPTQYSDFLYDIPIGWDNVLTPILGESETLFL